MLSFVKTKNTVDELRSYTYPRLSDGKEWFIEFYAFCPASGRLKRKRIKINSINPLSKRRKYAAGLMARISTRLEQGWNPWIDAESNRGYALFSTACDAYFSYLTKMYSDGQYRQETFNGYASYLRNLRIWNDGRRVPITYIYQFDRAFCMEFLDYIYLDRQNSIQTRNNYLIFLKVFSSFLVQREYLKSKPVEGITKIGKATLQKNRTVIDDGSMVRLHNYLWERNRYFLLACYFLHYVLIRPKEIALLKIGDVNLAKQTVFVADTVSKNKRSALVTLPAKVIHLMIDLDVFSAPSSYYIFSDKFMPGEKHRDEKQFRDYWHHHIRKDLHFPSQYKFYSLKDTGITEMLRAGCDTLSVKEQARHSSLLMTDIYTPHDIQQANPLLLNYEGKL